ncbi:MAG TPA: hypothetical protein VKF62_12320, partial [Planctomycetota bacterium]|nr:hypothetical protein [Planctomycetota bacterium]
NGDGFPDFAVGAPGPSPFVTGKVRAYSGAPVGVTSFGSGCGGAGGVPRIGATRSPRVGTTFSVNLSGTPPGNVALFLMGLSNTSWGTIPLPLDLAFLGMPGCGLLVSPDFVLGLTTAAFGPGNGRAVIPLALPPNPTLIGTQAYAQWYVADPAIGAIPGSLTRGLQLIVQS